MLCFSRLGIVIAFVFISQQMVGSAVHAVRAESSNEGAGDSGGTKTEISSQSGTSGANAEPRTGQQQFRRLRVLADPPPLPSGGSGADIAAGLRGEPDWIELDDFIPGPPPPPMVPSYPAGHGVRGPVTETPDADVIFDGVIDSPVTTVPPDTHIAVGLGTGPAGRIVEVTNAEVQIWDKDETGPATIAGPTRLDTMFGTNVFDPKVLFDQHSGRFFIVALELVWSGATCGSAVTDSRIHIAASTDGTPDNLTTDWTFSDASALITIGATATWADYPGIGADGNDSLFVTTNQFSAACVFRGTNIRVFDKSDLLTGTQTFTDISYDTAATAGVATMQPAHVFGTTDSGGFYLVNRVSATTYRLTHITGHPGAPTDATATYTWAAGAFPADADADQCDVTTPDLDTLSSRVQNAVYQTDSGGDGHLYLCLTSDPDGDGRTEVVWQDLATGSNSPTVSESGFVDGADERWTYIPSIAVDEAANLALSFTQSSATVCASVAYALKLFSEPAFFAPKDALVSGGSYDSFVTSGRERWGDYSGAVRDPDPEIACFWGAHEYAESSGAGTSEWGTEIWRFCTASKGACCTGQRVCFDGSRTDCDNQNPPGDFRGEGTACPTQNVGSANHSGTEVVHWVDPSINCFDITRRGGASATALAGRPGVSSTDHRSNNCPADSIGVLDPKGGSFAGSTIGSTNDFSSALVCGAKFGGQDEIFEFTVGADGSWKFDTCNSAGWDTTLSIHEETGGGCPGDFVACDGDSCGGEPFESALSVLLTAGTSYYLIVDGFSTFAYGDFTVNYRANLPCAPISPCDVWETSSVSMQDTCDVFGGLVVPALSADFFGPGSDPFSGTVCFESDPLGGIFGDADTVVARSADPFDRCELPSTTDRMIDIELVELSLRSIAPITVGFNGGQFTESWDVHVGLSSVVPVSGGTMVVRKTHCNGGVWSSELFVQPKYTFTKADNPNETRVLDTGLEGINPELLVVDADDQLPWVHDLDENLNLDNPCCTSFYPGVSDPNPVTSCDCNGNVIRDACDVEIEDCNVNGIPDECDPDSDSDGTPDDCDNCPDDANPSQSDFDGDLIGDLCDICPDLAAILEGDQDGDGIGEECPMNRDEGTQDCDNCPCDANHNQEDSDGDGTGDACETSLEPPAPAGPPHDALKNRYISVDPRGAGAQPNDLANMHIRVAVSSSIVPDLVLGGPWWANAPVNGGGQSPATCISIVTTTKPGAPPNFTGCNTLHLTGCPIVPTTVYSIRAEVDGELSEAALFETMAIATGKWLGDCVGQFTGPPDNVWTDPNFVVNIDDAVAGIKTFIDPTAFNATHLSVTDIHPVLNGEPMTLIVNINDVLLIIAGFQGKTWGEVASPAPDDQIPDLTECP